MKIVHVITDLQTGGAERMLQKVCLGLRALGVENQIISLKSHGPIGAELMSAGFQVFAAELPKLRPRNLFVARSMCRHADLIQGWMYHGNAAATFLHGRRPHAWNIRASMDSYADSSAQLKRVIAANRFLSQKPKTIIYNSHLSRQQHGDWGFNSASAIVIPNGFEIGVNSTGDKRAIRARFGIPEDGFLVLAVGRAHPVKDYPNLIRAVRKLLGKGLRVNCAIVGRGLTSENNELAAEIGPDKNSFYLLGEQREVSQFYACADVFALSSRSEAFPNVVGEAMSWRLPCVATDVGDVRQLLGDDTCVVPTGDPGRMSERLESLANMPEEKRSEIGARLRERVVNHYSIESVCKQYFELYKRVVVG